MVSRSLMRWMVVGCQVAAIAATALLGGCDAGKEPFDRATELEKRGQLLEAAEQFDAVCERAQASKLCPPSQSRSADLRLTVAATCMRDFEFEQANDLLERVIAGPVPNAQERAKQMAKSTELLVGLRWERGLKLANKREVYEAMQQVAVYSMPVSKKAQEWLEKNGLPIYFEILKETCAKPGMPACLEGAKGLANNYPGTPEAAEAQRIYDAYLASEKARVVAVLIEIEGQLEACAKLWKQDKVFQGWSPAKLALERDVGHRGGGSYGLNFSACKDDGVHDTCKAVRAQDQAIKGSRSRIGYFNVARDASWRRAGACYAGEYVKQKPQPPDVADMGRMPLSMD